MALVERLCQTYSGDEEYLNLAISPFVEACFSVLGSWHTVAEMKAFYQMRPEDEVEFDALIQRINARGTIQNRMLGVERLYAILTFWEWGAVPGYQTVSQIRAWINAI
jgi:hypothetical protein